MILIRFTYFNTSINNHMKSSSSSATTGLATGFSSAFFSAAFFFLYYYYCFEFIITAPSNSSSRLDISLTFPSVFVFNCFLYYFGWSCGLLFVGFSFFLLILFQLFLFIIFTLVFNHFQLLLYFKVVFPLHAVIQRFKQLLE